MNSYQYIAILGLGYCVPDQIRGNDDPVFDQLRAQNSLERELFSGLHQRRVLEHPADLLTCMTDSARAALNAAACAPEDIGMVLGSGSVGRYFAPSDLAGVHRELGLGSQTRVMPLSSEYTGYLDGLKLAHDLIRCGTIENALVVCGNNWTHHVDYRDPVAWLASDGAGAALVGRTQDPGRFRLLDWENETQTQYFGALSMVPRPAPDTGDTPLYGKPLMTFDGDRGFEAVREFGVKMPPLVVQRLLQRHGLKSDDVALMSHQSSEPIFRSWSEAIRPGQYLNTLLEYGDMVAAAVPVTLARYYDSIDRDWLVLMGIGMEMRVTALLLARG